MSYPGHDWRAKGWPSFNASSDWCYRKFNTGALEVLKTHKRPGDFLLCPFGDGHRAIAEANRDMIIVEPGIGYPTGGFAPFRIFESYAIMHAYQGQRAIGMGTNNFWYDAVIPNYFDLSEFEFSAKKDSFFLFLGRINPGKGIHIAQQIALDLGRTLVVAGSGDFEFEDSVFIEKIGVVNPGIRSQLLKSAAATICASTFMEPFCGVQVESFLSGTPVISSDRGAFAEYNLHGVTGYRCRTMGQFIWAANNIENISPYECRSHGERFSLERISHFYDEYFRTVQEISTGKGWYEPRKPESNLDYSTFTS
jgi:glycosyltransferase involved in cell wall biosynthesis